MHQYLEGVSDLLGSAHGNVQTHNRLREATLFYHPAAGKNF
jgi:hypothetical protein